MISLFTSPVFAQADTVLPPGYRGGVACINNSVEIYLRDGPPMPVRYDLWITSVYGHEVQHVFQYTKFSNCVEADSTWNANPQLALDNEVEATCEQLRILSEGGEYAPGWVGYFIWHILDRFSGFTTKDVVMSFGRTCGTLVNIHSR